MNNQRLEPIGTDTAGDLKRARSEIEFMKRSMSELKRKCKRAVETTEKKISETEDLRLELEEANREKSEWEKTNALRFRSFCESIRRRRC